MPLRTVLEPPTLAVAVTVAGALVAADGVLAWWVYRDAGARGSRRPRAWALGVAVVPPALLAYLYRRRALATPVGPETRRERLARVLAACVPGSWVVATLVAPPDPLAQLYYAGATMAVGAVSGYLAVFHAGRRSAG